MRRYPTLFFPIIKPKIRKKETYVKKYFFPGREYYHKKLVYVYCANGQGKSL